MSYEEALGVARSHAPPLPEFDPEGEAVRQLRGSERRLFVMVRVCLVATAIGYAGLAFVGWVDAAARGAGVREMLSVGPSLSVLLPLVLVIWSILRLRAPAFGTQMILRGAWWSSLLVGTLVCMNFSLDAYRYAGLAIAMGSGLALLGLRQRGLERNFGTFAPVAYRGELLLALVLAAADALNLLFWGLGLVNLQLWAPDAYIEGAYLSVGCGLVMVLAVWGLSRLRTWALFLNMVANLVIAGLGINGVLELPVPVVLALFATAVIQLFLPVPILAAALGDEPSGKPRLFGWGPAVVQASIVGLLALSAYGVVDDGELRWGWTEGVYRTRYRGLAAQVGWATDHRSQRRGAPTPQELEQWGLAGDPPWGRCCDWGGERCDPLRKYATRDVLTRACGEDRAPQVCSAPRPEACKPLRGAPGWGRCCEVEGEECDEARRYPSRSAVVDACLRQERRVELWCPATCAYDANADPPCDCQR